MDSSSAFAKGYLIADGNLAIAAKVQKAAGGNSKFGYVPMYSYPAF